MNTIFHRQKSVLVFVLNLLFLMVIISAQVKNETGQSLLNSIIFNTLTPFQVVSSHIIKVIKSKWNTYIDLRKLHQKNQILKQQIRDMQYKYSDYREIKLDNKRFRELLSFNKRPKLPGLFAEVIALDSSNFSNTITINKGSSHGLNIDMPVICPQGVVGKIIKVTTWASQVQLLIDGNSALAAMDQRSRVRGVVVGLGKHYCHLKYVDVREDVAPGDMIITSGEEGVFPKGFIIGKIVSTRQKDPLLKEVSLIPAVNFQKLEEVLILLKIGGNSLLWPE